MLKRLAAHTSAYTAGSLLTTAAGLISFPIFTRIFSVEEYGLMSLVSSALLFLVGFAKLGVQNSIIRFHGEMRVGEHRVEPSAYYSTVLFGMAGMALAIAILWAAASQLLPSHLWNDARVRGLLLLTSMLVVVRAADSALVNLMRAKERSVAFNLYAVIKRYGSLAVILLTVTFFVPGISGFYVGTIVMEVLAVSVLYFYVRRTCEFRPSQFSWPLYKSMLAFGIPMIASELGGVVLNLSDRFVLQHFLGPEALGLYSAAYNLCDYVQTILIVSMGQAIVPMYVRIWREQGEAATRRFVQDSMHYYLLVGAAVVAGLAALQADLLVVLASEKYRDGAVIIPFAAAGMVINGGMTIFGAGLYIHKQTRTLAYLVAGCAVFNVSLNMVLVPRLGLLGAALCTLTSYSLLSALTFAASNKRLPLALPWRDIGKFCLLAFVMYLVVSHVHVGGASANLLAKVATGALVYALLVLAFDGRSRLVAAQFWRRQQDTP